VRHRWCQQQSNQVGHRVSQSAHRVSPSRFVLALRAGSVPRRSTARAAPYLYLVAKWMTHRCPERHGGAWSRHPRLCRADHGKTWMAGPRPSLGACFAGHDGVGQIVLAESHSLRHPDLLFSVKLCVHFVKLCVRLACFAAVPPDRASRCAPDAAAPYAAAPPLWSSSARRMGLLLLTIRSTNSRPGGPKLTRGGRPPCARISAARSG
jgi:hypothetical protein